MTYCVYPSVDSGSITQFIALAGTPSAAGDPVVYLTLVVYGGGSAPAVSLAYHGGNAGSQSVLYQGAAVVFSSSDGLLNVSVSYGDPSSAASTLASAQRFQLRFTCGDSTTAQMVNNTNWSLQLAGAAGQTFAWVLADNEADSYRDPAVPFLSARAASVEGALSVGGAATVASLAVTTSTSLSGPLSVGGGFSATGPSTLAGLVAQSASVNGALTVTGQSTLGALSAYHTTVAGGLSVTGNVGLGTTAPTEALEVSGNVKIDGSRLKNASGYGVIETNATDWLRINPDQQYPAIALYKPVAIGTGGLSIGDWTQQPPGQLHVTGNAIIGGDLTVGGGGSRLRNNAGYGVIETNATDWLRINPDQQYPGIALYKPVAIGSGGLAVGEWSQQPVGQIKATAGALLNAIGVGTQTYGATQYPYETIQMNPGNNLRIWFGTTQRLLLQNNGQLEIHFASGFWAFQPDGNLVKYNNTGTAVWALQKANGGPGW